MQTSHQTLASSITKRTHHLDPVCEIQPTRTHPPRVFGLNLSAVQSISLERSAEESHRTPLDGIAIHHTTGEQTSFNLWFNLVRDVHHPRQTPCNLSHHQQLNNNIHSFDQLDASISRASPAGNDEANKNMKAFSEAFTPATTVSERETPGWSKMSMRPCFSLKFGGTQSRTSFTIACLVGTGQ